MPREVGVCWSLAKNGIQFHFHHPSEEPINRNAYDMEIHLMYQAADGGVVGVAVFIKRGAPNRTIQVIWQHMQRVEGEAAVTGVFMNPADLVPQSLTYYSYIGSQTAPPCTEPVTWFVLQAPVDSQTSILTMFDRYSR